MTLRKFTTKFNAWLDRGRVTRTEIATSTIKNSAISHTTLSMTNQRITDVADPINDQDAVTKKTLTQTVNRNEVILNGTTPTLISGSLTGAFSVLVSCTSSEGPCAAFTIAKGNEMTVAVGQVSSSQHGIEEKTALILDWPSHSGLTLRKTSTFRYNTSFLVKIL